MVKAALEKTLAGDYYKVNGNIRMEEPYIYLCDESMFFVSSSSLYSLHIENGVAYVLTFHENYTVSYRVPDEYYEIIVNFYKQNDHYPYVDGDIYYAMDSEYAPVEEDHFQLVIPHTEIPE